MKNVMRDIWIAILLPVAIAVHAWITCRQPRTEEDDVTDLANFYECSEYELFKRAAKCWGCEDRKHVAKDYISFIRWGAVPFYVRGYVKKYGRVL